MTSPSQYPDSYLAREGQADTVSTSTPSEAHDWIPTPLPCNGEREKSQTSRSIMYTIDALLMSLVLLAGLGIAFLLAPAPGDVVEKDPAQVQLESDANDILAISAELDLLKATLLYWDDSDGTFVDSTPDGDYTTLPDSHPLHDIVEPLQKQGLGVNIAVEYQAEDGLLEQQRIIHQGTPSGTVVTVSESFTLSSSDSLVGPDSGTTIEESTTYFVPDSPGASSYNTVTVTLTLWQA